MASSILGVQPEAVFALIGVVIGGAVNLTANVVVRQFEFRRSRRIAARAIGDELSWYGSCLAYARDTQDVAALPTETDRVKDVWREHRAALASIPMRQYNVVLLGVMTVVDSADVAEMIRGLQGTIKPGSASMDAEHASAVTVQIDRLTSACSALRRYA